MSNCRPRTGEGFTQAEAQYAVDHVGADWNKEALESARSYLEMSPMSRNALIEQLSSSAGEGFTYEQALYAVNKAYGRAQDHLGGKRTCPRCAPSTSTSRR